MGTHFHLAIWTHIEHIFDTEMSFEKKKHAANLAVELCYTSQISKAISWVDLPGLYEGGVGRVGKSWGYAAKVGGGEVEGKVCVSFKIGVG